MSRALRAMAVSAIQVQGMVERTSSTKSCLSVRGVFVSWEDCEQHRGYSRMHLSHRRRVDDMHEHNDDGHTRLHGNSGADVLLRVQQKEGQQPQAPLLNSAHTQVECPHTHIGERGVPCQHLTLNIR